MKNYYKMQEAVKQIHNGAEKYEKILNNKNLLIIYNSLNNPLYIQTIAKNENFLHLTGVKLNKTSCPSTNEFYRRALNSDLKEDDFRIKDINTINKLLVLSSTLSIYNNATMVGDYSDNGINLYTEKLAGGEKSCLGFKKINGYYVPNTVLREDIRKITSPRSKIFAILVKEKQDYQYENVVKIGKGVNLQRLLNTFNSLYPHIHISNALLGRNSDSPKHTSHEEQTVDSDDDILDLTGGFSNLRR